MIRPTRHVPRTQEKKTDDASRLGEVEAYGSPRKVWVEDGHVFVEGHDGVTISMTPEVAIKLGQSISEAGTDSLINRVIEQTAEERGDRPTLPPSSGTVR